MVRVEKSDNVRGREMAWNSSMNTRVVGEMPSKQGWGGHIPTTQVQEKASQSSVCPHAFFIRILKTLSKKKEKPMPAPSRSKA